MSDGLNRVTLLGNLGADPELRFTQSGNAVLNLRIATTETYLDKDGNKKEDTQWTNCVLWGKRAEALSRFLAKGSRILVEGSLNHSSYDDKDSGAKRYKTEVKILNVILCDGGGKRDDQRSDRGSDNRNDRGGYERGRDERPEQRGDRSEQRGDQRSNANQNSNSGGNQRYQRSDQRGGQQRSFDGQQQRNDRPAPREPAAGPTDAKKGDALPF